MSVAMRVLIVDDQPANRLLLASLLNDFGYDVVLAADGHDALNNFSEWAPDIVLLDIMMPGITGYELAPKLKELAGTVHLPIIFITALDEQESLLRCLSVGGDDFLPVPFEPVVLQAKLRAHQRVRELSQSVHEKNRSLAWHSARIDREHRIVEHIFRNALSRNYLDYEHIETHLIPASMFSGDLCLVAAGPLGNLYVLLGDFTGHGLAPATGALPLSQAFFTMADRGVSVAEMVTEFNQRLLQLLPDDMFCAAIMLEISASGERLTYWNGGMPTAFLINDDGEICERLPAQHMALGILPGDDFDSRVTTHNCHSQQRIVLHSDGVTELRNQQQQIFGEQRFEDLLTSQGRIKLSQVVAELEAFRGNKELEDDVSLAILRCKPTAVKHEPAVAEAGVRLPFELKVTIGVHEMKHAEPVTILMSSLSQLPALKSQRGTIFMLLSEAYNNALEHGLLGLDSGLKDDPQGFETYYQQRTSRLDDLTDGQITIKLKFDPTERLVQVKVSDSGAGVSTLSQKDMQEERPHGRGLALLSGLTENLEWLDNGRTVQFDFRL
ncbi:Histidine kinase-like ATPase domain-containing protein [Pseudidiomarina planktonica]|uniref:Histidine kinase-like ATPase domain-containing protein n=2 Tax=Pseudidiomarina planktonica TaxID=1323738 RepID=A0A1Y6EXU1_9GAMM|nr:hypothetical protein CWI77_00750 [Pseudidiomarina planktonica]SMQ67455.1 Histidine kinase-like ATPase domain-containing protein [Pseudidiomarina planktonica]